MIAKSFERIHRSNLIGMGVLPLSFLPGEDAATHHLTGEEVISIDGIAAGVTPKKRLTVKAGDRSFQVIAPHRYPAGGRVHRPRRHPPVRPAPARRPDEAGVIAAGGVLTSGSHRRALNEDAWRIAARHPLCERHGSSDQAAARAALPHGRPRQPRERDHHRVLRVRARAPPDAPMAGPGSLAWASHCVALRSTLSRLDLVA
ncbi:MAG TPA: hypothetical protein VF469_40050 [Kofleriaceae bacterium]